ncbi:MAG TPA: hypothetical protein VHZ07_10865 [Bryobacteraceae bacterium]|jgi:hypothetical protein|nr:hypothetical protein [Bryobacteraceae bacterium]
MERLKELKSKYQSVLDLIKQRDVVLSHLHVQDTKLFMQGAAPSLDTKNEVWNQIKAIDPHYEDLTADIKVDTSLPPLSIWAARLTPRTSCAVPQSAICCTMSLASRGAKGDFWA